MGQAEALCFGVVRLCVRAGHPELEAFSDRLASCWFHIDLNRAYVKNCPSSYVETLSLTVRSTCCQTACTAECILVIGTAGIVCGAGSGLWNGMVSVRLSVPAWAHNSKPATAAVVCCCGLYPIRHSRGVTTTQWHHTATVSKFIWPMCKYDAI